MGDGLSALPEGHLLRTLLEEHDAIWRLVDRLDSVGESLGKRGFEEQLVDLLCLIQYLNRTEVHERREDRGLFAVLEGLGHDETKPVRASHARAAALRERLRSLAAPIEPWRPDLERISRLTLELAAATRAHLEREEEVIFPLAVRVIPEATWVRLAHDHPAADPCPFRMRIAR